MRLGAEEGAHKVRPPEPFFPSFTALSLALTCNMQPPHTDTHTHIYTLTLAGGIRVAGGLPRNFLGEDPCKLEQHETQVHLQPRAEHAQDRPRVPHSSCPHSLASKEQACPKAVVPSHGLGSWS